MESLQSLESAFIAWRQRNNTTHYPNELKEQVVRCLQFHSKSKVATAAGVSKSALYKWSSTSLSNNKRQPEAEGKSNNCFIELPAATITESNMSDKIFITLKNDLKIELSFSSYAELAKLISFLSKELS